MPKAFQRTKENFTCEHCAVFVEGNGYTNHCPTCLWSKHVDVEPGDRKATCNGMMEPTAVQMKDATYVLTHTCVVCGYTKPNKLNGHDDMDAVIELAKTIANK